MAKSKIDYWLTEDGLTLLKGWARDGLTDEQIANNCGIVRSTLSEWKKKHQAISDSLKKGKEVVDIEVENALLKSALGYEYEECTYESGILTKKVKKQAPPNTTALIFWLKNRKPKCWRGKVVENEDSEAIKNANEILIKIRKSVDNSAREDN